MATAGPKQANRWLWIGIAMGLGLGAAVGFVIRDPSVGIAAGVIAGALIAGAGSSLSKK